MEKISLTTVTPVYRGARHLEELIAGLEAVRIELERGGAPLELREAIFVDDASQDGSSEVLTRLATENAWVRVLYLARNFGQHPATVAGVLHSSGDWVATLDEDLQHRPDFLVPMLGKAVAEGHDLVYARPRGTVHGSLLRDASSRFYKLLLGWITGDQRIVMFNSFRMIRGSVARAAAAVSRRETYFDVALCWFTDRIGTLPLPLREIREGKQDRSGYSFRSLLTHARRLLLSSELKPLRIGGLVGGGALGFSLVGSLATVILKLLYPELIAVRGWPSLILAIFFFGGLISLLTGVALEYISDLHLQALGRPTFFVVDRAKDRWLKSLASEGDE